ncbi:MAG TPA: hypothetical protein VL173_13630 [Vicinamibacterales bacterium]|nr:hypothetical protein [Vicinamibacterales bacterium]
MRIRLTRKLAELLNGVDLSRHRVGDVFDLPLRDAQVLVAEGWARPAADQQAADHTRVSHRRVLRKRSP